MINHKRHYNSVFIKSLLTIDLDYLSNNMTLDDNGDFYINKFKFDFIKKLIDKNKDKIFFIENHGMVPSMLKRNGFIDDYDLRIVNIDHHHDIYYRDDEYRDLLRYANYFNGDIPEYSELENCWIGWICTNWNVIRCDEILNENSSVGDELLKYGFRFHKNLGSPFNPYDLDLLDRKFHYVYVVSSPDYITDDQLDFICRYLGIDKTAFLKDGDDNAKIR